MKQRVLCLMLTLVLLMGMVPGALAAPTGLANFRAARTYVEGQFSDVNESDWFSSSVKSAYELGLVNGAGADTFNPNGNITLAETLALAARLHHIYNGGDGVFTQDSPWYQVYVNYALENDIIAVDTYSDYTAAATRTDFAAIMAAAFPARALNAINEISAIPDVSEDAPASEAIYRLYNAGILTGSDAYGTFHPSSNIRRSEVATIVTRMADPAQRKSVELLDPTVFCQENLQGRWVHYADNKMDAEYVFSGDTVTYSSSYRGYYNYFTGTFTVEGESLILTGRYIHRIAGQEPTVKENYEETQPIFHFNGVSFTEHESSSAPFTKTDDPTVDFATQVMAEINYRVSVPIAEEYAYLAGADFRSVRRQYSSATANAGYVIVYKDENGDNCALTYVSYKIISNYSVTTLHNLTTGTVITNPSDYYDRMADRAYGANRIKYLGLASEVMGYEIKAMQAIRSIQQGGSNTGGGVYVNAATLNM